MKGSVYSHGPRNVSKARREVESMKEVIDNKKLGWRSLEGKKKNCQKKNCCRGGELKRKEVLVSLKCLQLRFCKWFSQW